MRPYRTFLLSLPCVVFLIVVCHGRALFQAEQYGYRDAGHFYYPLYERVEQEWNAGRIPLWEPEENAGMPLLGNPTAAVLYPGKAIIRFAPTYALGARFYVVSHSFLAFLTMFALLAHWKISGPGRTFGALAYAFGGPILFQYCNIIYLVGAAWLPLGIRALDLWLREGNRRALLQLAVVLAMEVLGGDPEVAYLTGLCGGGYAIGLAYANSREIRPWPKTWAVGLLVGFLFVFWVVATLVMARFSFLTRPFRSEPPVEALVWMPYVGPIVATVWGLVGLSLLYRYRRKSGGGRGVLIPLLAGLAGSALLAALLCGAQLLPVFEFTAQSGRAAGDGPHDIFPFSLEPLRCVEFLWPNLFGTPFQGNRSWLSALPATKPVKVWVPTLYVGGLTLIFGLGAAGFRRKPSWQIWMTSVALISLLLSFGEFTSPLYWARFSNDLTPIIGVHDSEKDLTIREDRHLRDGDGSLYFLFASGVPGFRQFRFPAKLLTFTVLALSALAARGFDRILAKEEKRPTLIWSVGFLTVTAIALGLTFFYQSALQEWLKREATGTSFGPIDIPGAVREMRQGLIQGVLVLSVGLAFVLSGSRHKGFASIAALVVMSVDLAHANSRYVLTVPQSMLEGKPEVLKLIEDAEKGSADEPFYRVHRMPLWNPYVWNQETSKDRVRDFVEWERATLQPKYGIPFGLQYTTTIGVTELYDYQWFFGDFMRRSTPENARYLNIDPGKPVVVYPRRAFDLWNTRYFVLPYYANHWDDEHRAFGSMLENTTRIYPPEEMFAGPDREKKEIEWTTRRDFQIRRNNSVYPRAWVVHTGRFLKNLNGMTREGRSLPMQEILFSNELLWKDQTRIVYDPREVVWVDASEQGTLAPFLSGGGSDLRDSAKITALQSDKIEIDVELVKPGLVVLAEVYYPGWTLKIDGVDAPVFRANRMMRGAAVESGKHHLIYSFQPKSFYYGCIASLAGLTTLMGLSVLFFFYPGSRTLDSSATMRSNDEFSSNPQN